MTARTSAQSGLWSATSTWVGGVVPQDTDSVTVALTHIINFDVDQSGFATGLSGLTINGILAASTTPGDYYLKMAATVTFGAAGQLQAGDANTDYPTGCTFTIFLNGNYFITSGTDSIRLYGQAPTNNTVLLTADEAIGATVIEVDTDVTGDIWAVGDTVNIADINGAVEEEDYVIAGIAAGAITLAGGGLTVAKSTGAVMTLTTRNVRIVGASTAGGRGINGGSGPVVKGVGFSNLQYGAINCTSGTWNNNSWSGCANGLYFCTSGTWNNNAWSGCTNGAYLCTSGTWNNNSWSGCANGLYFCTSGTWTSNTWSGCTYGARECGGKLSNCTFSGNTSDIYGVSVIDGYNCSLNSATQVSAYTGAPSPAPQAIVMWDIGGVAEAVKAWMNGGRVTPDAVVFPTGYTTSHKFIHENAMILYLDFPILITDKTTNIFTVWMRRDTASMTQLPRVEIIDPASDPLFGGTALYTYTVTATVDTWQEVSVSYTATRQIPGAFVRISAINATGNSWFQVDRRTPDPTNESITFAVSDDEIAFTISCEA